MNGGGWSVEGWQHEHADGVSHFPPVPGYPSSGAFATSYLGTLVSRRVLRGPADFPGHATALVGRVDKDSLYVDIDQPGTTNTGKGPGKQSGCTYVNCDPATAK